MPSNLSPAARLCCSSALYLVVGTILGATLAPPPPHTHSLLYTYVRTPMFCTCMHTCSLDSPHNNEVMCFYCKHISCESTKLQRYYCRFEFMPLPPFGRFDLMPLPPFGRFELMPLPPFVGLKLHHSALLSCLLFFVPCSGEEQSGE